MITIEYVDHSITEMVTHKCEGLTRFDSEDVSYPGVAVQPLVSERGTREAPRMES